MDTFSPTGFGQYLTRDNHLVVIRGVSGTSDEPGFLWVGHAAGNKKKLYWLPDGHHVRQNKSGALDIVAAVSPE